MLKVVIVVNMVFSLSKRLYELNKENHRKHHSSKMSNIAILSPKQLKIGKKYSDRKINIVQLVTNDT